MHALTITLHLCTSVSIYYSYNFISAYNGDSQAKGVCIM